MSSWLNLGLGLGIVGRLGIVQLGLVLGLGLVVVDVRTRK